MNKVKHGAAVVELDFVGKGEAVQVEEQACMGTWEWEAGEHWGCRGGSGATMESWEVGRTDH